MDSETTTAPSRYRLLGQIGRGGMAEVILAEMRLGAEDKKLVVLKRIWPHLAAEPAWVSMFLQEARLGASMNHPNIVATYEVLESADRPAIALEYLDGQPLVRVLNRLMGPGSLDLDLRLRILNQLLAALGHAHDLRDYLGCPRGIVHRDVNPQNVFVTYDGQIKLVDFGVATSSSSPRHARSGSLPGKLAYMAPEQLQGSMVGDGGTVDRRADLFSVGVMLWEMTSGRRLWQGMSDGEIVRHLTSGAPIPPADLPATAPPALAGIVARALASDPDARFATAAEFQSALDSVAAPNDEAQSRRLGNMLSLAFAHERTERQALIEAHTTPRAAPGDAGIAPGEIVLPRFPSSLGSGTIRHTPGGPWTRDRSAPFPAAPPNVDKPRSRRPMWIGVGFGLGALVILVASLLPPSAPGETAVARQAATSHHETAANAQLAQRSAAIVTPIHAGSVIPWPFSSYPMIAPRSQSAGSTARPRRRGLDSRDGTENGSKRAGGALGRRADDGSPLDPQEQEALLSDKDDVLEPTLDLADVEHDAAPSARLRRSRHRASRASPPSQGAQ